MAKMQAHLLPGYGSFLRIEGDKNHRFQSYYIDQSDVKLMVNHVAKQYNLQTNNTVIEPVIEPVISGYESNNHQVRTRESKADVVTRYFPIKQLRDLDVNEIAEIKTLASKQEYQYQGKPSINKLVMTVFGSKSPERMEIIKKVLGK
jgi:hypothetical protein